MGTIPRGYPWTHALMLPHVRDGLSALLRAVLCTCHRPSMCRPMYRPFMRNALLDLTAIVPATACHQRNDIETYSKSIGRPLYKATIDNALYISSTIRCRVCGEAAAGPSGAPSAEGAVPDGVAPGHAALFWYVRLEERCSLHIAFSLVERLREPRPRLVWRLSATASRRCTSPLRATTPRGREACVS